ncbi:unnamed protein product [Haemonchus placei]|uniref:Uncharacterized protein n=1 Tax=Haemonchus placei TaxID=6290 RepID=A0A0N4W191_HAEPC|nr:unnamed protein product [Haemonchus placei]
MEVDVLIRCDPQSIPAPPPLNITTMALHQMQLSYDQAQAVLMDKERRPLPAITFVRKQFKDPTEDYSYLSRGMLKCADISRRSQPARILKLNALAV